IGWASPAWAPPCASCKTSFLFLPLSDVFSYPAGPVVPAGENVSLDGHVLVVAHVESVVGGKFLTDIYATMAGVTGVGQTTKKVYIAVGFNKFLDVAYPADPIVPANPLLATFSIERTARGGSVPLPLTLNLALGGDGKLLPSSTVSVAACN